MSGTVIKRRCAICGKVAHEAERFKTDRTLCVKLDCGHYVFSELTAQADYSSHVSSDGRSLYPYQVDGVKFLEQSGFRAGIFDEMGLGKTVQAVVPLGYHPELLPTLVICKSGLRIQWMKEIIRWCGMDFVPCILESSRFKPLPGFKVYIISFDLLRNYPLEELKELGIQYVIVDECQHIKNPSSQRTQHFRQVIADASRIVALSGTPIENRASEYFTILNALAPTLFPAYNSFLANDVNYYHNGYKTVERGLVDPKGFHEKTKDLIIRRRRSEVAPDLPRVDRKFFHVDLNASAKKAYIKEQQEFTEEYNRFVLEGREQSFEAYQNLLARIARLRHITGVSKIRDAIEYAQDFLATTDRKLAVFLHHVAVGTMLERELKKWCEGAGLDAPLVYRSGMDAAARNSVVEKFAEPDRHRLLIASTLASGEGLNLQYQCSDCLLLERQWNPSKEEQVEARFTRPDSVSMGGYVSSTYMIASNTIDEYFTKLVEQKRQVVSEVLEAERSEDWNESELMKELFKVIAKEGRKQLWSAA